MKVDKQEFMNRIIKVRDSLFYRIKKSQCLCNTCKEDLEMTLEELEEAINNG